MFFRPATQQLSKEKTNNPVQRVLPETVFSADKVMAGVLITLRTSAFNCSIKSQV
jgi:hypothetical protein